MKRLAGMIVLLLIFLIYISAFVVQQGQYALKINQTAQDAPATLLTPGLHFKWPFFNKIIVGTRLPQQLVANGTTEAPYLLVQTFDHHNLELGYSFVWQINDPIAFYTSKKSLLPLRNQVSKEINLQAQLLTLPQLLQLNTQQMISDRVVAKINHAHFPGIKGISVFITSVNIATLERTQWINQMSAQQAEQLSLLQAQTATLSQKLRAATDAKIATALTEGVEQADKIRADADSSANKIYADAYNKDPSFYEFFQNLELYKKTLTSKQDLLVLSTHTTFFKSLSPDFTTNQKSIHGKGA